MLLKIGSTIFLLQWHFNKILLTTLYRRYSFQNQIKTYDVAKIYVIKFNHSFRIKRYLFWICIYLHLCDRATIPEQKMAFLAIQLMFSL